MFAEDEPGPIYMVSVASGINWLATIVACRNWIVDNYHDLNEAYCGVEDWDWTHQVGLTDIVFGFKDPTIATMFKLRFAGL
jgi:hypothetical protein